MAGVVATGYGGAPVYGGTPFSSLTSNTSSDWTRLAQQNPAAAAKAAADQTALNASIAATQRAWEQTLENDKIMRARDQADRERAAIDKNNQATIDRNAATNAAEFSYGLNERAADSNVARMKTALGSSPGGGGGVSGGGGGGGGGGVSGSGGVSGGGGGGGGEPDTAAADAAAMGRAKDTSAAAVGAAARAMKNNMGARGIAGSGIEAKQDMGIQLAGAGELGAAGRQVAESTAARARAVADRNYLGGITMRGQDLGAAASAAGQQTALTQSLMSLFKQSALY